MRVTCQSGNHIQRRILPYADLVLRGSRGESVGRNQLMGCERPRQITDLCQIVIIMVLNSRVLKHTWLPVSS